MVRNEERLSKEKSCLVNHEDADAKAACRSPLVGGIATSTIFTNKIFPPQNKPLFWKCAAPRQTKLLTPDWSHFYEFEQLFQMGPIWLSYLYSFRSSTLSKLIVVVRWKDFFCEDSIINTTLKLENILRRKNHHAWTSNDLSFSATVVANICGDHRSRDW